MNKIFNKQLLTMLIFGYIPVVGIGFSIFYTLKKNYSQALKSAIFTFCLIPISLAIFWYVPAIFNLNHFPIMITWLFLTVFFPPILLGVLSNKIIEKLDFNKSTFRNDQKQRSFERDILSSDKLNIYPAFYPGKGDGVRISMNLESIKDLKDILVETGYFLKKSDLIKIDNRRVFHIFIKGPEDIFEEALSVLGHMINSNITLAKVLKGSSVSFCMNSEEGNLFEGDLNDVARELVVKGQ